MISFIPSPWTGSISDKEIVRNSGLVNLLEEGDSVMADKSFLVRDLLVMKKVSLISTAYVEDLGFLPVEQLTLGE